MYAQTYDRDAAEAARDALYDELRARALARRDWTRLLNLIRLSLVLAVLLTAGLIIDYDLNVLSKLDVSISFFTP